MILALILDQKMVSWVYFSSVSKILFPVKRVQSFGVVLNIRLYVDLCPNFVPTYNYNTIYYKLIAIFIFWVLKNVITTMFFYNNKNNND